MNEEFSDYEVLVATSTDGGEITQDISWKVEASKDIVVWCDIAGLMKEGTFRYDGNSITINGYDRPFTAYIMRKECAEYVISKNANGTFSVDTILEQLKKNVRILEQLEETDTRTLQCVDEVNPITDKDNRIGKVLSFDKDGNPVCEVEVDDVEKIITYRNEALASADSASASADSASGSAYNASISESSASASASSASATLLDIQDLVGGFDTTVSSKQTEVLGEIDSHFSEKTIEFDEYADGTISEIEGIKNQAQALLDNAVEITDPDRFMRDIQMFKANSGALHFGGGNAQCSGLANKPIPNINTIAFRWKCDAVTFENIPVNQRVIGYVDSWYHLTRISGGLQFYVKYVDGQQYIGLIESNIITLLTDGNWHNVAIISTGTTFDFAIDGKILKSVARSNTTNFAIPTSNFIVSYSTTNIGSIADVFIFNFDITSADAPYTLADYQQGKPIPPKAFEYLNQNVAEVPIDEKMRDFMSDTPANKISWWERDATITVRDNAITWKAKDTQTGYPKAIVYKFAKALTGSGFLKVDIGNISKVGSFELVRFGMIDSSGTWSYPSLSSFGFDKGEQSFNVPYTNGCLAITIGIASAWENGDSFTIDYLKVEHNGTILALEDYTIANGNSKFVFDYSGNNNDATITGDVKGDNDNRVQKLVDFITTLS